MRIRVWIFAVITLLTATAWGQDGLVKSVRVVGNRRISSEAILAVVRTKPGSTMTQAGLEQDQSLVESMGFFSSVEPRTRHNDDGSYDVLIAVQEFEIVKSFKVTGNKVLTSEQVLKLVDIRPGEIFNQRNVGPSSKRIVEAYSAKGFFVGVNTFAPMADQPDVVQIELVEMTVGDLDVDGITRTRPWVMQRLIKTKRGEPFSADKWRGDLRRIYETNWFSHISATNNQPNAGTMDLGVQLKDQKTAHAGLGFSIDSDSSFAGNFKVADTNFRGTGQTIAGTFEQSVIGGGPSIQFDYVNPFVDDRDTTLSLSAYSRVNFRFAGTGFGNDTTPTNADRYYERRTGLKIGVARPIRSGTVASVSARFEAVKTSDLGSLTTDSFIQEDGNLAAVRFGLSNDHRDVDTNSSRGSLTQVSIEPGISDVTKVGGLSTSSPILGTNGFAKFGIEYRTYLSDQKARPIDKLDDPRRVLALRLRYGGIAGKVPFFEQYFVGGVDSLRGYQDDRFWGREQFIANLEYRYPITRDFNLFAFADYGGAWGGFSSVNSFTQSATPLFHFSFGPGASLKTKLGIISFDFGLNEHHRGRIEFQLGKPF